MQPSKRPLNVKTISAFLQKRILPVVTRQIGFNDLRSLPPNLQELRIPKFSTTSENILDIR